MSLRLDPKYHGVRVARVRPKESALIKRGLFAELWASSSPNEAIFFRFVKAHTKLKPEGYYWRPRAYAADVNGVITNQKAALEALGLR